MGNEIIRLLYVSLSLSLSLGISLVDGEAQELETTNLTLRE